MLTTHKVFNNTSLIQDATPMDIGVKSLSNSNNQREQGVTKDVEAKIRLKDLRCMPINVDISFVAMAIDTKLKDMLDNQGRQCSVYVVS